MPSPLVLHRSDKLIVIASFAFGSNVVAIGNFFMTFETMAAGLLLGFCSFFIFGVQKCSRTVFTRGEVFIKIAFFRRNIVTVFAYERLLATFGYFWVRFLIVTVVVGRHGMQIGWRNKL
jgi:hypothetical protein